MQWEMIDNYRQRLRVPGGWIYEVREDVVHSDREMRSGWDWRVSCCFVPDPEHVWSITEKG